MGFLLFIPLLIVMYLILVRPQQQRVRRQRELIMSIDVGDDVVTAGGIIGRIVELGDDRVWLEVADDVVLEVLRAAISRKLEEGRDAGEPAAEEAGEDDYAEAGEHEGDHLGEAADASGPAPTTDAEASERHDHHDAESVEVEQAQLDGPDRADGGAH